MKKTYFIAVVFYLIGTFYLSLCKRAKQERITKGSDTHLTMYPFAASIIFHGSHKCGGSIISHAWILTAAHCCYNENEEVPVGELQISVGNVFWKEGQFYRVRKKFIHEQYDPDTIANDIALLKTKTAIKFGLAVSAIALNSAPINDQRESRTAVVLGWGLYMNADGEVMVEPSEDLQHVSVNVLPKEVCMKHYPDVSSKTLCTYGGDSKGSCDGDSGGPLIMESPRLVQIGIVSYGSDCSNSVPEVYTNVFSFYPWIKETMRNERHGKSRKHL